MPYHRRLLQSAYRHQLDQRGFTLIELLVTLAVAGILFGIALPSLKEVVLGSKLTSTANTLVASSRLARSEAIKRNTSVTMCVSSNGTSCGTGDWEQGWVLLAGTTVLQAQPAAPGLKIIESASTASLTFQSSGVGSTQATFTVCRASPTPGSQERQVSLSATGRTTVTKTTTGSCA